MIKNYTWKFGPRAEVVTKILKYLQENWIQKIMAPEDYTYTTRYLVYKGVLG